MQSPSAVDSAASVNSLSLASGASLLSTYKRAKYQTVMQTIPTSYLQYQYQYQ